MEQRTLGSTGVWVSKLCPGTMMFGEWRTKDQDESIRVIHRALEAGITFVDPADVYSAGESEGSGAGEEVEVCLSQCGWVFERDVVTDSVMTALRTSEATWASCVDTWSAG